MSIRRVGSPRPPVVSPIDTPPAQPTDAGGVTDTLRTAWDGIKARTVDGARAVERRLEQSALDGRDGFVALDGALRPVGGDAGGVFLRSEVFGGLLPRGLATITGFGDGGEKVTYQLGAARVAGGRTSSAGQETLSLDELSQLPLSGLHPRRGGVVSIAVEADGATATQRVLALPRDYDGPIFVSDIDDTLRETQVTDIVKGTTQEPIPGAKELLEEVAARGVPVVYLSAGPSRIASLNDEFLAQLPPGVLLARSSLAPSDLDLRNRSQARTQGDFKTARLAELRAAFPKAQLIGLGDDKYGDAIAYTRAGATAFIRDVRPGDDNLPAGFAGTQTRAYDAAFRARVLAAVDGAIGTSDAFK